MRWLLSWPTYWGLLPLVLVLCLLDLIESTWCFFLSFNRIIKFSSWDLSFVILFSLSLFSVVSCLFDVSMVSLLLSTCTIFVSLSIVLVICWSLSFVSPSSYSTKTANLFSRLIALDVSPFSFGVDAFVKPRAWTILNPSWSIFFSLVNGRYILTLYVVLSHCNHKFLVGAILCDMSTSFACEACIRQCFVSHWPCTHPL